MWDGVCLVGTQLIDAHGSHWHAAGARPILVSKQLVLVFDFVVSVVFVFVLFGTPKSDTREDFVLCLKVFVSVFFCCYCCCCFRLVWKCRRVMRRKSLTCRRRWRCHRQNATRALYVCVAQGGRLPTPSDPFPRCWFVATRRFCATGTIGDHNRLESTQREYYDLWAFRFLKFCCFQLCW